MINKMEEPPERLTKIKREKIQTMNIRNKTEVVSTDLAALRG